MAPVSEARSAFGKSSRRFPAPADTELLSDEEDRVDMTIRGNTQRKGKESRRDISKTNRTDRAKDSSGPGLKKMQGLQSMRQAN